MPRILCYGDSNTYGYDPRSWFGGRYPKQTRWTGRLSESGYDVINEGENGRTIPVSEWMLERTLAVFQHHEPFDLLCVMLGSNDLLSIPAATAYDVTERMDAFLTYMLEGEPGMEVLLLAPPAMHRGEWVTEDRLITESARMAECYRELAAQHGILFADAEAWGIETGFDGVHYTENGHAAFAEGIGQFLRANGF